MFWKKFILLCNANQVSPNAVCAKLGLSTAIATKWKAGATPRDATLQKIADYFNIPLESLLSDDCEAGAEAVPAEKERKRNLIPVLGNVAAGIPIEAITDIEDYEEIDDKLAASGKYVALRIHGDSMQPRMVDGDVVIVRLQQDIDTGDIAVVMVNGGSATCKKIKRSQEGLVLISLNPIYEPMFFTWKQVEDLPVTIFGKVVELRAKF